MTTQGERRAAALEAIAHALLDLAALEREPEESAPSEVLIDRRNCEKELGLRPRTFLAAASDRDFPAFLVARRVTATKADVFAWLKTRRFEPKPPAPKVAPEPAPSDPADFLKAVHARFVDRIGRPMTDYELYEADLSIEVGHILQINAERRTRAQPRGHRADTPDDVAARVQSLIGKEPRRHGRWRNLGLDPADLERKGEELRQQLLAERPDIDWRQRMNALWEMWSAVTEPIEAGSEGEAVGSALAKRRRRN